MGLFFLKAEQFWNLIGLGRQFFLPQLKSGLPLRTRTQPEDQREGEQATPHGYIESYGTFLPPHTVSSRQTVKAVKQVRFIPLRYATGIRKRRASDDYGSLDLSYKAIEKCLARSSYRPEEIDLIVCCNICKCEKGGRVINYEPTSAIKAKHMFGLHNAVCYDINNACAGMFTGIYIANKMIASGAIRRALIFSGEYISHIARTAAHEIVDLHDPRLACLTLGDAGAAVVIDATTSPDKGIMHFDIKTFPEYSDLCIAGPSQQKNGGIIMHTDSHKIARHGFQEAMAFFLKKVGDKSIKFDAHSIMIPHQISRRVGPRYLKKLRSHVRQNVLRLGQIIDNVGTVGNTASTAHFVALAAAISKKRINNGTDVVMVIQASGLNIGMVHYKMDDLPSKIRSIKKHNCKITRSWADLLRESDPVQRSPRIMLDGIATATSAGHDTAKLAAAAANDCLVQNNVAPERIDHLIHSGLYRSQFIEEPSHAAMIAGHLGLNHAREGKFFGFDIVNAAVGWLNAVYTASFLVDQSGDHSILLTASECDDNKACGRGQSLGIKAMGSAVLLRASQNGAGFSHFHFRTFSESITAREVNLLCEGPDMRLILKEDANFEDLLTKAVVQTVTEQLLFLEKDLSKFAAIILPQHSTAFIDNIAQQLAIPREKLVVSVKDENLFTNGTPTALQQYLAKEASRPGDQVLVVEATSGIQVAMAIYTC